MHQLEKLFEAATQGNLEDARLVIRDHPELINHRDDSGASALHCAALAGRRAMVQFLVQHGADINARDAKYGATPAGWAIEYMREMGGLLGVELSDFAFAIRRGDVEWTARFLLRFPALRHAADGDGTPFTTLAERSGNSALANLFNDGHSI